MGDWTVRDVLSLEFVSALGRVNACRTILDKICRSDEEERSKVYCHTWADATAGSLDT